MATAMTIEDLFPSECDFYRTSGLHRQFGYRNFVTERIALPAEPAAIRACDDLNSAGIHFKNTRESAMHIMRCLGCRPQNQLAVRLIGSDGGVLFHGQMGVALVEERVVQDEIGLFQSGSGVAEFERDGFMNVSLFRVALYRRVG